MAWQQPIEDMLQLLESRFHVFGGDDDFYYGYEFDQRRYIHEKSYLRFIFVMDGPEDSYIYVDGTGVKTEPVNFFVDNIHKFPEYLDYLDTILPDKFKKPDGYVSDDLKGDWDRLEPLLT